MWIVEELPLNNPDKQWVRDEIREAFAAKGWNKVAKWLRDWGAVGAAITGAIALVLAAV